MDHLTAPLAAHHKACDAAFADLEEAVGKGEWERVQGLSGGFSQSLLAHFGVEEDSLFPAFERRTGMMGGPTRVMRIEHMQMRSLLEELAAAIGSRDRDETLGVVETLLVLMQQHNLKEENILYPMCDDALGQDAGELGALIAEALSAGEPA